MVDFAAVCLGCSIALNVLLYVPQMYKTLSTKNVSGFSKKTIIARALSNVMMLAYGTLLELPLMAASSGFVVFAEMATFGLVTIFDQ